MKKMFLIGWKDLTLAFRDRAALILMLLAPFFVTLGLGLVTGSLSGGSGGISQFPVVIQNQDLGQLGTELVDLFQSAELADLLEVTVTDTSSAAYALVDEDQVAAAVLIPADFSASIIPDAAGGELAPLTSIEVYSNPNRPTGAGVIQSIVEQFVNRVEIGRIGGQVAVTRLIETGRVAPQDAIRLGEIIGTNQAHQAGSSQAITLEGVQEGEAPQEFNALAYMAPGMALMFLMFTVSNGGRTLLQEKTQGTLPRLLITPVNGAQVLAGKMFGIFLTGVAQVLILILASTLLFQLEWGDPLAVLVLVLAAVIAAVGWGMLITALVKTPNQATTIGSAIMLVFGILGGSFFQISQFPGWFQLISKVTPNAWGMDGFTTLALGGGLTDILPVIGALLMMAAVLFGISLFLFNRRGIIQR